MKVLIRITSTMTMDGEDAGKFETVSCGTMEREGELTRLIYEEDSEGERLCCLTEIGPSRLHVVKTPAARPGGPPRLSFDLRLGERSAVTVNMPEGTLGFDAVLERMLTRPGNGRLHTGAEYILDYGSGSSARCRLVISADADAPES